MAEESVVPESVPSTVVVEDLAENFANLFKSNDGWIVAVEESNQQKFVKIGDESEIEDCTREWVDVEDREEKPLSNIDRYAEYKPCLKLFIADVLRTPTQGKFFVFKNITFCRAFICGTVLSSYLYKENHTIVVDDGTGTITCFLAYIKRYSDQITELAALKDEAHELFLENPNDPVFKIANVIARNSLARLKQMPMSHEDVKIGATVSLLGRIKEHAGNRYLFVTKMVKHTDDWEWVRHLKEIFHLYEHYYK